MPDADHPTPSMDLVLRELAAAYPDATPRAFQAIVKDRTDISISLTVAAGFLKQEG